jgi:hypothetical protein
MQRPGIVVHTSTNGNVPLRPTGHGTRRIGLDSSSWLSTGLSGDVPEISQRREPCPGPRMRRGHQAGEGSQEDPTPRINMRFVVMQHNEGEIDAARETAEAQSRLFHVEDRDMPKPRGRPDRSFAPENKRLRRYAYEDGSFSRKERPFVCMRLGIASPWTPSGDHSLRVRLPQQAFLRKHRRGNRAGGLKGRTAQDFRKRFNSAQRILPLPKLHLQEQCRGGLHRGTVPPRRLCVPPHPGGEIWLRT